MNKYKLKILTFIVIALVIGFALGSYSTNTLASGNLQSQEKLVYNDSSTGEEVIIDTADHQLLQNNIDSNTDAILDIGETTELINSKLGTDDDMTIHEKLDYIINNELTSSESNSIPFSNMSLLASSFDLGTLSYKYTFTKDVNRGIAILTTKRTAGSGAPQEYLSGSVISNGKAKTNNATSIDSTLNYNIIYFEDVKAGETIEVGTSSNSLTNKIVTILELS